MKRSEQKATWQSIEAEVLRRIRLREWAPGDPIPHEDALARELGCARSTVNRALRSVAEKGLIERRRRAGSHVALNPVRRVTLNIPVLRQEIEDRGATYGYVLISEDHAVPPAPIRAILHSPPDASWLHIRAMHFADGKPHVIEDRWIDDTQIPQVSAADFAAISPNEWLVRTVPFESGDISFLAEAANGEDANLLGCMTGDPVFVTERTTRQGGRPLTTVRLVFAPGHKVKTQI